MLKLNLKTDEKGRVNRSLNEGSYGARTVDVLFCNNALLFCLGSTVPFHLVNLRDYSYKVIDDWYYVLVRNKKLYCRSDRGLDVVDTLLMDIKSYSLPQEMNEFELYLPWIDETSPDFFKDLAFPQQSFYKALAHQADSWYSTISKISNPGELFQLQPCPTFSIKRTSIGEFQITNTSPNCQTPLDAKVYLIPWPNDWCPSYWQAKDVVATVGNLKLNEQSAIKVPDLNLVHSNRFALVVESNGLLDTKKSELSSFDNEDRPLFDGKAISYSEQKSVIVTVWGNN